MRKGTMGAAVSIGWAVLLVAVLGLAAPEPVSAQTPEANPADVASIDAVMKALYDVISGPAGQSRDWDRMRSLFIPEAQLVPTGTNPEGGHAYRVISVEDYITGAGPRLEKDGFFEKEIHRVTEQYGNIAHSFSTYESFRTAEDTEPFMRGINSFQLMFDGDRWWIVSVYWQGESPAAPIPDKYGGQT